MKRSIRIGISTCPNDTFAFHGLMNGKVDCQGLDFRFELLDVEQLNQLLLAGEFDVVKASFHAALLLSESVGVLDAGSALGFGVGPLLLAGKADCSPSDAFVDATGKKRNPIVLCPGAHTTANLLYRLFFPGQGRIENVVFSDIMPRLKSGQADFGVCIHEGRFTYREEGLACVADLGDLWERETNAPLPLGGIVARHELGGELHHKINAAIRASIEYGLAHRSETVATMKRYAQEFSENVLFAHVDLYVNDWTVSLSAAGGSSADGWRALALLCEKARQARVVAAHHPDLQILGVD